MFTALILGGDFFTGSVLASALAKLVLRYTEVGSDQRKANAIKAEVCVACVDCVAYRRRLSTHALLRRC